MRELSDRNINQLTHIFNTIDNDRNGTISMDDVISAMDLLEMLFHLVNRQSLKLENEDKEYSFEDICNLFRNR